MMEIKWTQWDSSGLVRCGRQDYNTVMKWMRDFGSDAKRCLANEEKTHALYGRAIHNKAGRLTEIRFYCEVFLDDEELDAIARSCKHDTLYVIHK